MTRTKQAGSLDRNAPTWLVYAALGCLSYLLNGLGAVLEPIRSELDVTQARVAFYPSLFSAGLLVVGTVGGAVVARIGRPMALRLALTGTLAGGLGLALPSPVVTLAGMTLIGASGALLIQLIPAILAALHPRAAPAAVAEANALASGAAVVAPLAVAAALTVGAGWRAGYLAVPLAALAVLVVMTSRVRLAAGPVAATGGRAGEVVDEGTLDVDGADRAEDGADDAAGGMAARPAGAPLLPRWSAQLLAVSVEFCVVFWAAAALTTWHGTSAGQAAAAVSLFFLGMASARAAAVPITRRLRTSRAILGASTAVAAAGFALFWTAPILPLAAVGLFTMGLGIALMYPTTVSRVVAAWPHAPDRAAARAALASGLGIGAAPFVLARLADGFGMRAAYLLVPILLAALATYALLAAPDPRPATATTPATGDA